MATALIYLLLMGLVIVLPFYSLSVIPFTPQNALHGDIYALAFWGCLGPMLSGFAIGYGYLWRRRRAPIIVGDAEGLQRRVGNSATDVALPWQAIRAWVVVPPAAGSRRPPTYIVFADTKRLSWTEPEDAELGGRGVKGDRRAAYRERAAQLHAMIAARTALPLRELRVQE
jgi:hypothetical protein